MIKKQELFPVNILRVKFPDAHLLNGADEEVDQFFSSTDTLHATNVKQLIGNYESTLNVKSVDASVFKSLDPLRSWLGTIQHDLWTGLGFAESLIMIDRSWVNRLNSSDTDVPTHLWPHVHGSTDMVCVYYHRYPVGSASIRFHNPMETKIPCATTSIPITPEEGELICFPGWLWHSVDNHVIDQERMVFGFHFNQQSYSMNPVWNKVVNV